MPKIRKNPPPRKRTTVRRVTDVTDQLDDHAAKAANMLYDPCGADLVPTVYPGERGYINRFSSLLTSAGGSASETVTVYALKPGVNVSWNAGAALSSTTLSPSFADTQAPGAAFLNTSAAKFRCPGACLMVRPNSSVNNATGMIYYGVVSANLFDRLTATSTVTADNIIPFLSNTVSCSQAVMQPLEIKWSPGTYDEWYCLPTGLTGDDDDNRNMLLVVATGMPAASGLNIRATAIYEWTPANSVASDATAVKPSRCDLACILRNLKRKDSEWWWALGRKTAKVVGRAASAYAVGGIGGVVANAPKFL